MNHTVVITKKPVLSGKQSTPDGAICGNGDLAAVLGSSEMGMRVFLGKSDLWYAADEGSGIRPLGYVDINIPAALYNNVYRAEQRMDEAKVVCDFREGYSHIGVELMVPATANALLIKLDWSRNFHEPTPSLNVRQTHGCVVTPFTEKDVEGAYVAYEGENLRFETRAKVGMRRVISGENSAVYAVMVCTEADSPDFRSIGLSLLEDMDEAVIARLQAEHKAFWDGFYAKSAVSISDSSLENDWYASQYLLAVCRGKPMFPPGLYGNFITVDKPSWGGDYHLNYNYEAPFYAAVSSNHPELTDYYADPLFAAVEGGRKNASDYLGCEGIYFPVSLGPKGLSPEEDRIYPEKMFLGQKLCASYAAVIPVLRWRGTLDTQYARSVLYPYLLDDAAFWDSFLKKEKNGRYSIVGDAIHEIPYYQKGFRASKYKGAIRAKNSVLSLGLVRMVYSTLLSLAEPMGATAQQRDHWQEVLDHLSPFPKKRGKYIYTQRGPKKYKVNTVGIQHIFPVGEGMDGKKAVKTAKKTVEKMKRWQDENGTNSLYPAAVRVGIPADEILKHYIHNREHFLLDNGLYNHKGGCLENVSLGASMLNEMMLQCRKDVIRVFPNWKKELNCEFRSLRADGAFLVSAKMEDGFVRYVEIVSEKGAPLTLVNPFTAKIYGGCEAEIGGERFDCAGAMLEIDLAAGASVRLTPKREPVKKLTKKEKKKIKKSNKKAKKAVKRAKKAVKKERKDDIFFAKLEVKTEKKQAKKAAKKEKKENKKYAKFDKKTAKYARRRAKRRK